MQIKNWIEVVLPKFITCHIVLTSLVLTVLPRISLAQTPYAEVDRLEVFQVSGRSFAVIRKPIVTWSAARNLAQHLTYYGRVGDLAVIDAPEIATAVLTRQASKGVTSCWIGLQYVASSWVWVDDRPLDWTFWIPGEPSGDSQYVAQYLAEYSRNRPAGWNDEGDRSVNGYIAEFGGFSPRQARATVQAISGFVVAPTITNGGYGYTNNPAVEFVGGGGTGAAAVALKSHGVITQLIMVNYGSGYTSSPQVVIAPPPWTPQQAIASAQLMNDLLVAINLSDGGWGYTQPPRVWLLGGGGSGATASSTLDTSGIIISIQVINPGSGYTNAPHVVIEPPIFPVPEIRLLPAQIVAFNPLLSGTSYQLQTLSGTNWIAKGTTVVATNLTHALTLTGRGDYRLVTLPLPRAAKATPTVVNGLIASISVTDGGTGYTFAPSVLIQDPTGAGATTSVTVVTGAVTKVEIISPGSGYSTNPIITIASPPVVAIAGRATPAVTLSMVSLVANVPYQLERTSDLKTFEPVGDPFLPTGSTNSVTVNAGTGVSFYRVVYRR